MGSETFHISRHTDVQAAAGSLQKRAHPIEEQNRQTQARIRGGALCARIQRFVQIGRVKFSVFAQNKACKAAAGFAIIDCGCAERIPNVPAAWRGRLRAVNRLFPARSVERQKRPTCRYNSLTRPMGIFCAKIGVFPYGRRDISML